MNSNVLFTWRSDEDQYTAVARTAIYSVRIVWWNFKKETTNVLRAEKIFHQNLQEYML